MKITVCIATLNRNEGLGRLLAGLDALEFHSVPRPRLHIIVVDNDPGGGAASVCENTQSRWPLTYLVEPRRGIPFARNRALRYALQKSQDAFVFVDDDEVPEPDWLEQLLLVYRDYNADVVSGPVFPRYPKGVEPWVIRGNFFMSRRFPTGTELPDAYTNNTMVSEKVVRSMDSLFREALPFSGGSDTHFFLRIARRGYRLVWADEAIVYDWVPRERATIGWLLKRAYRTGNSGALIERDLTRSPLSRVVRAIKGAVHVARGAGHFATRAFRGKHELVWGLCGAAHGLGMIAGALGIVYHEYAPGAH